MSADLTETREWHNAQSGDPRTTNEAELCDGCGYPICKEGCP